MSDELAESLYDKCEDCNFVGPSIEYSEQFGKFLCIICYWSQEPAEPPEL